MNGEKIKKMVFIVNDGGILVYIVNFSGIDGEIYNM